MATCEPNQPPQPNDGPKGERIAKVMARAGIASRRESERMILAGRVRVDGELLNSPACVVTTASRIEVDGKPLSAPDPTQLWLYNKPAGLIVSRDDPQGRPTLFDSLPKGLPRLITVGRLDLASEGLILLTNNGDLAQHLQSPKTGWKRQYRVRAFGEPRPGKFEEIAAGASVRGVNYGPVSIEPEPGTGRNRWYRVSLREGKNREVRKLMAHAGLKVNRLIRTAYGPCQLGALKSGTIAEVPKKALRAYLGDHARRFGL